MLCDSFEEGQRLAAEFRKEKKIVAGFPLSVYLAILGSYASYSIEKYIDYCCDDCSLKYQCNFESENFCPLNDPYDHIETEEGRRNVMQLFESNWDTRMTWLILAHAMRRDCFNNCKITVSRDLKSYLRPVTREESYNTIEIYLYRYFVIPSECTYTRKQFLKVGKENIVNFRFENHKGKDADLEDFCGTW